ncbi:hypothetical protein ACIRQQ_46955 [Streptomyces fuscichromogenes]|uniref:hypothetical protein n=1 Tax=Streptomyces fuscichromogenes TaxID=1324013 RepID=UPI0038272097
MIDYQHRARHGAARTLAHVAVPVVDVVALDDADTGAPGSSSSSSWSSSAGRMPPSRSTGITPG